MRDRTDSADTFAQIECWMQACVQTHQKCKPPRATGSSVPSRLVSVEEEGKTFRLVTDAPQDTRYLTLSYRWGSTTQSYMLTEQTQAHLLAGLPTAVLPKTLQDGCCIATGLGFRYLWVDRLCILQDSREDWSFEASKMAEVYRNSFCTISASGSFDEDGGCFRSRMAFGIQPMLLCNIPLLRGRTYYFSDAPQNEQKEGKFGHLSDRGWVFQERAMSCRILHFGDEQVHWECAEAQFNETWPWGEPDFVTGAASVQSVRPSLSCISMFRTDLSGIWTSVVEEYSRTKLTYESDKLPALAGLANEVALFGKDEYLAGLWRRNLLAGLCWRSIYENPQAPKQYRAPSWSWPSLDAPVTYGGEYARITWRGERQLASVKDVVVTYADTNAFGSVTGGWVILFGNLIPVLIKPMREGRSIPAGLHYKAFQMDGTRFPGLGGRYDVAAAALDIDFSILAGGTIRTYCVPLVERNTSVKGEGSTYCLLLAPKGAVPSLKIGTGLAGSLSSNGEEYQRIGLIWLYSNHWGEFREWLSEEAPPKQDIVIR